MQAPSEMVIPITLRGFPNGFGFEIFFEVWRKVAPAAITPSFAMKGHAKSSPEAVAGVISCSVASCGSVPWNVPCD
jgi:hypothetical protein